MAGIASAGSVEEPVSGAGKKLAQKALLKQLIDRRLDRAGGKLGRIVQKAGNRPMVRRRRRAGKRSRRPGTCIWRTAADRVLAEAAKRFDVVPIYSSSSSAKKDRRDGTSNSAAASSNSPPPEEPDFKELDEIIRWLAERNVQVDKDQYKAADGIDTAIGVRLDPRVGEPAAGRNYRPDHPSHLKGLQGEFGLVNDYARQFPDHTIIEFGRKAGESGPDVISVDPNGEIIISDSKWRGADTSISPSRRAHQTKKSLDSVLRHTEPSIKAAMESGRLSSEAGARALENWKNGNVTIVTVGTGNARNGVIERILGDDRAAVHPKRRP